VNHGHRNNYDPLAANFHSRNDYWRGVSPSKSRPLGSAGVERYLVARTGFGLSAVYRQESGYRFDMDAGYKGLRLIC
jgi:hypothetical protein